MFTQHACSATVIYNMAKDKHGACIFTNTLVLEALFLSQQVFL